MEPTNTPPSKSWNITLWIAQILLALGFAFGGYGKAAWTAEALNASVPWASAIPMGLMRFIGITELLAAVGLILPALLRIRPGLTPLAAAGLALIMVLAAGFHLFRGEYMLILANAVYFGIAVFIAWGRAVKYPITSR